MSQCSINGCSCNKDKPKSECCVPIPSTNLIELLRFFKEPVQRLSDLYVRYPDGGEWGWFSFVVDKGAFAYWNVEECAWALMSNENPEQLLNLISNKFRDGDMFVWSEKDGKFILVNLYPLIKKLERIALEPVFEPYTDYWRPHTGGDIFRTKVKSRVGEDYIEWEVDPNVTLPNGLTAYRDGDFLVIEYNGNGTYVPPVVTTTFNATPSVHSLSANGGTVQSTIRSMKGTQPLDWSIETHNIPAWLQVSKEGNNLKIVVDSNN